MITSFKIFENINLNDYIDNFLIQKSGNTYSISMCVDIRSNGILDDIEKFFVEFDCFDIDTTDKEFKCDTYGDHENLTKEEFEKFASSFLTPSEFYNKYTDICTYFYENIKDEVQKIKVSGEDGDGGWYPRFIKNFKRVLETIPEFEHFGAADKYNL